MLNTSSRLAGVLVANSKLPWGDNANGRTCPDSKSVNEELLPEDTDRWCEGAVTDFSD
jgi:hypothetical protein